MVQPRSNAILRVVDSAGQEHIADLPSEMVDLPCVVCRDVHVAMNFLGMTGTFFCHSCWYKMGMRPIGGGAYAHLEPDILFVGDRANIPACPTYDASFGVCTPFRIIQQVKDKADLRRAIDECLGEHGRVITDEHLQDACTSILNSISDEQFACLLKQGKL